MSFRLSAGPLNRYTIFNRNSAETPSSPKPAEPSRPQPDEVQNKMPETFWEKTKGYSSTAYTKALKPGFDKAYAVVDKLGAPINRLSNRVGAEAFWPTTLDKESDKAARILRGFCKDGFYDQIDEKEAEKIENREKTAEGLPQGKQRVLVKIPTEVIQNAKGLAIFTTMRTGWLLGGSGGAGVLIGRHPKTGEWSPPSGIMTQNLSFGFLAGVDIYDTVLIINNYEALEAFTKLRTTLGTEVGVAAGPVGLGGSLDTEVHKRQAPVWSYVKSRGLYAGVAIEGNLVIVRSDENERFYGEPVEVADILVGKVRYPPRDQYSMLMATVKAAQGDTVNESLLPEPGNAPSDMDLINDGPTFGIPDVDDPDPFGVKALEAEGLNIREAGTHQRPSAEVFEFKPAPSSPIYGHFARKSVDGSIKKRRSDWRGSTMSTSSITRGTQTEGDDNAESLNHSPQRNSMLAHTPLTPSSELDGKSLERPTSPEKAPIPESPRHSFSGSDLDSDVEISTAVPMVTRARVVEMPKRVPPALPPRNPGRVVPPEPPATPAIEIRSIPLDDVANKGDEDCNAISSASQQATHAKDEEDYFHSIPPTPSKLKDNPTAQPSTSAVKQDN